MICPFNRGISFAWLLETEKLRTILAVLCRLTGEAEGILLSLTAEEKQSVSPMLGQCVRVLLRFSRFLADKLDEAPFSPGKKASAEVEHDH